MQRTNAFTHNVGWAPALCGRSLTLGPWPQLMLVASGSGVPHTQEQTQYYASERDSANAGPAACRRWPAPLLTTM